jgi:formamidopyrimidine-DNA glycosylase
MPELPDLIVYKQYSDATSLHQRIKTVDVDDDTVLRDLSVPHFRETLTGRNFESSERYGKNLLVELEDGPWVRFHFGMTGRLLYYKNNGEFPRFTRILIRFSNGYELAYTCIRKLGRISLTKSVEQFIKYEGLGPDALQLNLSDFKDLLSVRRGSLKTTLMNQKIIAGLGNVYVDEILFQARLDPSVKCKALDDKKLGDLFKTMREVLKTASDNQADPNKFPKNYLTKHRSEGEPCHRCSGLIEKRIISQRPTYVCPKC